MKRWVILIIVAAVCAAAAIAYGWWLPPLLHLLGVKGDLIQTLARLLALVPATVSAVTGILGLKQRAKSATRVHNETVTGPKVTSGGDLHAGDIVGRDKITTIQVQAKSPESALHQLPAPPRDFTGRDAEIAELMGKLKDQGAIISCQGMGGVGKTAIALVLAHRLAKRYPDAQVFLDLRGASDQQPVSVADAMAHVVRAWNPEYKRPNEENQANADYHAALHGKRAILVMDNARDRAQVEPLVPPETCVLLVTTRRHFALPGMYAKNLDELPPKDARKLLLAIVPRAADVVDDLARLCGYLPIALRLAGSALAERPNLTPAEYVNRLTDATARLGLIDGPLSLSYDLLLSGSQRRFAMLAAFPGTFDREGAAAVWMTKPEAAQDALGELVGYSLVEFDEKARRYRLHDLARVFADSRLAKNDRGRARLRHAAYYLWLLGKAAYLYLKGGESVLVGLGLFDLEWENIEAGQTWGAANAATDDAAARLCSGYPDAGAYCIGLRLHPRESIRWREAALAAARRLKDRAAEGFHLGNLGLAYADLGETRRAIEYHEQALKIVREIGDRQGEGGALGNLGVAYKDLGDTRRAIEHYEQHLKIASEIGDRRGEGNALGNLGVAYKNLGETRRAIEYHEQALAIAREIGDRRGEGRDLGNLGLAYAALGETRRAIEYYEQALRIAREIGDRRGEGSALGNLGVAYKNVGKSRRAIEYYERVLAIDREVGDRRGEGNTLGNLGGAYYVLGETRRSIEYYEQHLKIAREIGDRRGEGNALGNLGVAYRNLGESRRAIEYYGQVLRIDREIGDKCGEGKSLWNMALVLGRLGRMDEAISNAEAALAIFEAIEEPNAEKVRTALQEWRKAKGGGK